MEEIQLEAVLENVPDGLFVVYPDGVMHQMNNKIEKMLFERCDKLKFHERLALYRHCEMDGGRLAPENSPTLRALNGEAVKNKLIRIELPAGEIVVNASSAPVLNKEGKVLYAVTCYQDITDHVERQTERIRSYQLLLKTERDRNNALQKTMDMKDEFISLITHEFKTPLTVIHSAIQAMEFLCKNELSVSAVNFISKIRQNCYRQLRLVNNLLDITRIKSGRIKLNKTNRDVVFLTRSIVESVQPYAQQKHIALYFHPSTERKEIGIDEEKYERILLNLLSNAIKFTPKGKSITVELSFRHVGGRLMLSLAICDQGIGIPEEMQEFIFDKFEQVENSLTSRAEGTGIGLHLVKRLVEAHDGTVVLKSKPGQGSTFTVYLPALKVKSPPVRQSGRQIVDNRLVQSIEVEFSNIYL